MGRRGVVPAIFYGGLVFFAITSTILPFGFAGDSLKLLDFTPLGLVNSPCPGFEGLLVNLKWQEDGLLVFGLVLSAAIPWLLTALFLKPGQSEKQADSGDEMQEAG